MAGKTGTHDINSLIATTDVTAVEFGEDKIAQVLAEDNANFSAMVQDMMGDLVAHTTDRQRKQGTSVDGEMLEADEFSRGPTQRTTSGQLVGFPLQKFQFALGWTRDWAKRRSPADFAIAQQAAQKANLRRIRYELKKAIFTPTNYTFTDFLVDNAELSVKALINADSSSIQSGPNGETFDGSSHTHYNANNGLTAAAVQATIDDVVEHGFGGAVRVYINQGNEAAFRLLTGFVGYVDQRLTLKADANDPNTRLDYTRMDNRPIGLFGAAEVWVKPWVPANYLFASDTSSTQKPFVMRNPTIEPGLRVVAEIDTFPLTAQYMEHQFGIGAWNRLNGAVLYFGAGSYATPSLSL